MTKAMHGVYIAIIAALLYFLWSSPETEQSPQVTKQMVVEKEIISNNNAEVEATITTTDLTDATAPDEQQDIETVAIERRIEQPVSSDRTTKSEHQREIEEIMRNAIDVDEVQQRIHTESIDQDWAYMMQDSIVRLYDENEELQGATLAGVECRTTVCRVEFTGIDTPIDHMQKFHQQIVNSPWFNTGYQSVMISNSKDKKHAFYIVRPQ